MDVKVKLPAGDKVVSFLLWQLYPQHRDSSVRQVIR
jgi:hypothetical protein